MFGTQVESSFNGQVPVGGGGGGSLRFPRIKRVRYRARGWFSACGCRGGALASPRGSIAALVRARAYALVSPRAISAYRARPATDTGRVGAQYERAVSRPGTPLRLAGVFADGSKARAPKYAQLIDPQGSVSRWR
ncbi:unnamed protein product [Plutella xylostella]|uniref:(diamondback moth) hypothetical protein n=1 Tax=Plutella xylostella TaxID=51655 RepID=A0A8S4FSI6_PLUXY|nr:unnamed protein product [Plutella xylostella]